MSLRDLIPIFIFTVLIQTHTGFADQMQDGVDVDIETETVQVPISAKDYSGQSNLPSRGLNQAQVEQQFGAPTDIYSPVGEPPISRWVYPGFTVYFENDLVLHSVSTEG